MLPRASRAEAVLRGGQGARPLPMRAVAPCAPRNETGCKVAKLHNTCIYSVASHSWCQITPFTQSCIMSSGILGPQIQIWPPQTAAARNASGRAVYQRRARLLYVISIVSSARGRDDRPARSATIRYNRISY